MEQKVIGRIDTIDFIDESSLQGGKTTYVVTSDDPLPL